MDDRMELPVFVQDLTVTVWSTVWTMRLLTVWTVWSSRHPRYTSNRHNAGMSSKWMPSVPGWNPTLPPVAFVR